MSTSHRDTIAATATPPGTGGVGIIRVSGPISKDILSAIFRSPRPSFTGFKPHTLHHGTLVDSAGRTLDNALAVFMPAPGSYTGQDTTELHCHGGRAVLQAVLERVFELGARPAQAGEFTKRAFLNGKLDLTQAEAVAEIIAAPSLAAANLAQARLSGAMGREMEALRTIISELKAQLCLAVDFPEDELECLPTDRLLESIDRAQAIISGLVDNFRRTRAWREGALVVLAGRVNAGKSSLMNALVGKKRAIVTDVPGTTRDYLEEGLDLDGLPVRLVDTAGLRKTEDAVEMEGLRMSREISRDADLVLLVLDSSSPLTGDELEFARTLDPERTLIAANKSDLEPAAPSPAEHPDMISLARVSLSAATGKGVNALAAAIRERILKHTAEPDPDRTAPNLRQTTALKRAGQALEALAADAESGVPFDLMSVHLDAAAALVAEITGEITPSDVLDDIFNSFCIGK